jgi:hypothetical protein
MGEGYRGSGPPGRHPQLHLRHECQLRPLGLAGVGGPAALAGRPCTVTGPPMPAATEGSPTFGGLAPGNRRVGEIAAS